MPVYEYTCPDCNAEFEELSRTMDDTATPICPRCGKSRSRRKLSVFSAKVGASASAGKMPATGCGRCGDPQGPCSTDF
ncbi:MAG: zinc ribbon domain-containing protein [Planctomycetes bacterium]|nr:zinc ribbon domain-containing protein [Planctomycetota bacterium]MBI3835931.1 zinc ribbon domain-containing protein [Planctomycetota bacterium]